MPSLYEPDPHKPGINGSTREWANAWDVFRRKPSRVGRGRQAAVDFVVSFGCGGIVRDIFFLDFSFFFEGTGPAASRRPSCLIYLSNSTGVRTGCHSVCVSVRLCDCLTFVVFADFESCTKPISSNPGPMDARDYGLTRGTCFVACCLEVVVVTGLLRISWCVLDAVEFRVLFFVFFFERTRPAASMGPPYLIYLSASTGLRTGCHSLFSMSVRLSMCNVCGF